MKTFKCIGRYKNGNKIVGYRIADESGQVREVSSGKLKDAIKSGEALVLNLTLSTDGRLIPKADTIVKPSEQESNITGSPSGTKVINFAAALEQSKGGTLLKHMLSAFDKVETNARIVECGYEYYKRRSEAYFYLETSGKMELEFNLIQDDDKSGYIIRTPINEYDAEGLDGVEYQLIEDIIKVCNRYESQIRTLNEHGLVGLESRTKLAKDFKLVKPTDMFNLVTAANNVVLLGIKDTSASEITIPDFVTVISANAFDLCSGLTKIVCEEYYQYRLVKDIISEGNKDVKVIRSRK